MLSSVAAAALLGPALASAYSFTFGSTPTQCENATINIVGDDGAPPYNLVILAYGHPPGGNEVRKIIDHSWDGKSTSVQIAFPSNSQFVAVVSDSKTVGSGGTSVSVNVAASDDDSCLPKTVSPAFFLFVGDETTSADDPEIDQCSPIRLAPRSCQEPFFDLTAWEDADDTFKSAARDACEAIFAETSTGLRRQYTSWVSQLETATEPSMIRKLEAAVAAAIAVFDTHKDEANVGK